MLRLATALGFVAWIAPLALPAQDTTRISLDSKGGEADDRSAATTGAAAMVNGIPLVVFHSVATNLVPSDTNGWQDIFLRDVAAGTTSRIVLDSNGGEPDSQSSNPRITPDGRFVLFNSLASDLVKGDNNAQDDVFVLDRLKGAIERVSVDDAGGEIPTFSTGRGISDDGNIVIFDTNASNVVAGDSNGKFDVFVRDRLNQKTICVSVTPAGVVGNSDSVTASVTADGRKVAFVSNASDLVANDFNGKADVFVRDLVNGTTALVTVNDGGFGLDATSFDPSISADGRLVAFATRATNLHRDSTAGIQQVFVVDLTTRELWLASRGRDGLAANGECSLPMLFARASPDGLRPVVAFHSLATNLFDDGLADRDSFAVDVLSGVGQCTSLDSGGLDTTGDHPLTGLAAPRDGEFLVLTSDQDSLVKGDLNGESDVFVRGLQWTTPIEFGDGLAGAGGFVPHLTGQGGSCEAGRWSIEIGDGLGGTVGHLWVGFGRTNGIQLFGGTFYVDFALPIFALPLALDGPAGVGGAGGLVLDGVNVENLGQFSILLQCTFLDARAPRGVSLSNALELAIDA